ncbi:MAG: ABC transporter permease subunit [Salinivirgaceae bacterium]
MFFNINAKPSKWSSATLGILLFAISIILYGYASINRHKENPNDKLIPTAGQMVHSFTKAIFQPVIEEQYNEEGELLETNQPRTLKEAYHSGKLKEMLKNGEWQLWDDTKASAYRVFIAVLFIFLGILIGLYMGVFPYMEKLLYRFILFFDKIPALAVLPILFIVFGLGETAKIALIVIGVAPTLILDTFLRVKEIPKEQVTKGLTLNASTHEIIYKIVFPQILPKVLDTFRLNFKAIILFLIAGEALAAEAGLGYRIFVVRRYMDMATIIPYVIWISVLAFGIDWLLRRWIDTRFKWIENG